MLDRAYIACDLKSFHASVECIERGLDPLTTNLVDGATAADRNGRIGGTKRNGSLRRHH